MLKQGFLLALFIVIPLAYPFACNSGTLGTTCYVSATQTMANGETVSGTGNLVIQNGGRLDSAAGNVFSISMGGSVTIQSGGTITGNVRITATDVDVQSGGSININGKGYAGGATYGVNGAGPGGGTYASYQGSGGGHGGNGGSSRFFAGGTAYDSVYLPADMGSGGAGAGYASYPTAGGNGGGLAAINASGTLTLNGAISANGLAGGTNTNYGGGGGAGGGVLLTVGTLAGSGSVTANGGSGGGLPLSGGGGAGGRIALYLKRNVSTMTESASGATGYAAGGAGTTYAQFLKFVALGITPANRTTYPNYNETFSLWVYNNQTASDNFTLSCNGNCTYSENPAATTPYQNKSVNVTVLSANASGTTSYTITATSQANAGSSESVAVSLTVNAAKWRDNWTDAYGNGFKYRIPITLNNTGGALADYQVGTMIDTASQIGAGKMRGDCGDLRLMNGTNEMPYWIEGGCNTSTTRIWARVPSIPAGNSTMYLYYGNSLIAGRSNGTDTFEIYDDFNRPNGTVGNGWTIDAGSATIESNYLKLYYPGGGSMPSLHRLSATVNGAWEWDFIFPISQTQGYGDADQSQIINDGTNFYYVIIATDASPNYYRIGRSNGGYITSTDWTHDHNWHRLKITRYNGNFSMFLDGAPRGTGTDTAITASVNFYLALAGWGATTVHEEFVDNLRVRKYASPEPAATAGIAQSKSYRTLVRRCGVVQPYANITIYLNGTYEASCIADAYGVCETSVPYGVYDLLIRYADNSTGWAYGKTLGG